MRKSIIYIFSGLVVLGVIELCDKNISIYAAAYIAFVVLLSSAVLIGARIAAHKNMGYRVNNIPKMNYSGKTK